MDKVELMLPTKGFRQTQMSSDRWEEGAEIPIKGVDLQTVVSAVGSSSGPKGMWPRGNMVGRAAVSCKDTYRGLIFYPLGSCHIDRD